MDIKGVGAIPCGRLYINGQGRATAPTYTTPSFRIYNPKAILIRILNPNNKASGLQTPKNGEDKNREQKKSKKEKRQKINESKK